MILRGIGIAQGNVADETEGDKRHLIYIAYLCDGARFHINSLGLRDVTYDLAHLLLGIDKPVACDDETWLCACQLGFFQEIRIGLITYWQALYLTIDCCFVDGFSTIHVMGIVMSALPV